jgi:hypothetical protein
MVMVDLDTKETGMIWIFKLFCMSVAIVVTLTTGVLAQWSIGQRGTREPPQGQNRYVFLVMSNQGCVRGAKARRHSMRS